MKGHSHLGALSSAETVGVDLGDKWSHYCVLDSDGKVLLRDRVRTTPKGLKALFGEIRPLLIVVEVGVHSPWVVHVLQSCGHDVVVANPRRVRLIYQAYDKRDQVDAESLARVGRLDRNLLSPIRHRDRKCYGDRAVLRSRDSLVRARTRLINHCRGVLKTFGVRTRPCSSEAFHRHAREAVPTDLEPALGPVLALIERLTITIRQLDRSVARLCEEKYTETKRLTQIPGVGPLTALSFVLTIEDPSRFRTNRAVGSYLGLRPRQRSSGDKSRLLGITKAGDPMLRRLLVGSAHYILGPFGPDSDLRRWGTRIIASGGPGAKKRAVVAVARKLSVLLHRLWLTGETYRPLRIQGAAG